MKKIVPYDPTWPERYQVEARAILANLGRDLLAHHHIGSTSVDGLTAKPIIDILLVVRCLPVVDRAAPFFIARGYEVRGSYGIAGRRYFSRKADGARQPHAAATGCHLHAFKVGHPHIDQHLAFRDYLRESADARTAYTQIKQDFTDADGKLLPGYQDGKRPVVERLMNEAMERLEKARDAGMR